jgi:hypothetical protein
MKGKRLQIVALVAGLFTLSTAFSSCGYILYPHRRGNRGGYIHGPTLVMDLLWLIPGIIPGVVALVVDFSSGAIYVGGRGRRRGFGRRRHVARKAKVIVVKPVVKHAAVMEVKVLDAKGRLLYSQKTNLKPGDKKPGDITIPVGRYVPVKAKGKKTNVTVKVLVDENLSMQVPLTVL